MLIHKCKWVLVAVLLSASALYAQPPAPPSQPKPTANAAADPNAQLDSLLKRWEAETSRLNSMVADVTRETHNQTFNRKEVMVGTAKFLRPDLARLDLKSKEDAERYERYICTGSHIYNIRPGEKAIYVYSLPAKQAGQMPDDGPLPFLFGMKAETAKQRYQLRITKQSEWYTYVDVKPNYPRDQADFTYARLVIRNDTFLPREIFWIEPNKTTVKWDVLQIKPNAAAQVQRTEFVKPTLPPGWHWENQTNLATPASRQQPPRVIRPQTDK